MRTLVFTDLLENNKFYLFAFVLVFECSILHRIPPQGRVFFTQWCKILQQKNARPRFAFGYHLVTLRLCSHVYVCGASTYALPFLLTFYIMYSYKRKGVHNLQSHFSNCHPNKKRAYKHNMSITKPLHIS